MWTFYIFIFSLCTPKFTLGDIQLCGFGQRQHQSRVKPGPPLPECPGFPLVQAPPTSTEPRISCLYSFVFARKSSDGIVLHGTVGVETFLSSLLSSLGGLIIKLTQVRVTGENCNFIVWETYKNRRPKAARQPRSVATSEEEGGGGPLEEREGESWDQKSRYLVVGSLARPCRWVFRQESYLW